eukprot:4851858-Pyramimonas_sp.AAC.1
MQGRYPCALGESTACLKDDDEEAEEQEHGGGGTLRRRRRRRQMRRRIEDEDEKDEEESNPLPRPNSVQRGSYQSASRTIRCARRPLRRRGAASWRVGTGRGVGLAARERE